MALTSHLNGLVVLLEPGVSPSGLQLELELLLLAYDEGDGTDDGGDDDGEEDADVDDAPV